ncbi:MAG TPA: VOC family protein [Candidatus Sulfotelmatobacter sp.]|jgi:predicted enzyme related to lactoylglutathione lyase|nr:VOC family protein [Candidatus Sulfotelmatobacter sp.]
MSLNPSTVVVWFEIPSDDFERAIAFYETILGVTLRRESMSEGIRLAVFPYQEPGISGCVVSGPMYHPSRDGGGTMVYLNCDGQLDAAIACVEPAGGGLLGPKIDLPGDMGTFIHIVDTEGNRVGLYAEG